MPLCQLKIKNTDVECCLQSINASSSSEYINVMVNDELGGLLTSETENEGHESVDYAAFENEHQVLVACMDVYSPLGFRSVDHCCNRNIIS